MTQRGRGKKRVRETLETEVHNGVLLGQKTVFVRVDPRKFSTYDKVRVTVELLARTRKG